MAQQLPAGSWYKGTDGKYWVLQDYGNNNWTPLSGKPRDNSKKLSTPPPDAPKSPTSNGGGSTAAATTAKAISIGPSKPITASTLRWPDANNLTVGSGTDYVLFEFGKYKPPFANESNDNSTGATALNSYNASATAFEAEDGSSIILPMPQDLSTEFQNTWQGKSFTTLGRAAVAAIGAGNLSKVSELGRSDIFNSFKDALTAAGLNKVPGVGGNLTMNDISGSSRGVILNPNAEVLYEAPNLREIGMVFKMVPQSQEEANSILKICQTFRKAASPSYGVEDTDLGNLSASFSSDKEKEVLKGVNYIHVPKLCKFTFMTGASVNTKIVQYKPCAMTRVDVNYTPDGTYATYSDGTPVAITLSVSFMETKLIFANEINLSGVSF